MKYIFNLYAKKFASIPLICPKIYNAGTRVAGGEYGFILMYTQVSGTTVDMHNFIPWVKFEASNSK